MVAAVYAGHWNAWKSEAIAKSGVGRSEIFADVIVRRVKVPTFEVEEAP